MEQLISLLMRAIWAHSRLIFRPCKLWEVKVCKQPDVAKILDNRGQADTFILDFKKAFDTHPHELLKSKLFSYGIGGKTLKWINSFLCFRQQLDNNELL